MILFWALVWNLTRSRSGQELKRGAEQIQGTDEKVEQSQDGQDFEDDYENVRLLLLLLPLGLGLREVFVGGAHFGFVFLAQTHGWIGKVELVNEL